MPREVEELVETKRRADRDFGTLLEAKVAVVSILLVLSVVFGESLFVVSSSSVFEGSLIGGQRDIACVVFDAIRGIRYIDGVQPRMLQAFVLQLYGALQ